MGRTAGLPNLLGSNIFSTGVQRGEKSLAIRAYDKVVGVGRPRHVHVASPLRGATLTLVAVLLPSRMTPSSLKTEGESIASLHGIFAVAFARQCTVHGRGQRV